jgi:hypothetical protein
MLPGMCDRQPWKASDLAAMARDEIAPGMVLGEKWHGLEELIEQKIRRQIGQRCASRILAKKEGRLLANPLFLLVDLVAGAGFEPAAFRL